MNLLKWLCGWFNPAKRLPGRGMITADQVVLIDEEDDENMRTLLAEVYNTGRAMIGRVNEDGNFTMSPFENGKEE